MRLHTLIPLALAALLLAGPATAEDASFSVRLSLIHISEPTRPY